MTKNVIARRALVEINATRYGLEKRTGVDFQRFDKNRYSGKKLSLSDKKVFPEQTPQFKLGSHDLARTLRHTGAYRTKKEASDLPLMRGRNEADS